ncbi:hypothetical protein PMIN04_010777 [Paraphaeosphaeria minitans]|uniref:Uncharacterized protein n=1 Tax=Paraphaeosphaeria minitans TaxID=565426 RepID=A0A9P6GQA1_9PLEO|nr:hypothetical protein PMIN01_02197 [Paraphaeosphaeria minitans]
MSSPRKERPSDREPPAATTDLHIVMAEQITRDVVKEAQSVGGPAPIDDTASTTNDSAGNGEVPSGPNPRDSSPSDEPTTTNATNPAKTANAARPSVSADGGIDNASAETPDHQVILDMPSNEKKEPLVNGDASESSATESQNALGEGSVGSDTDISRPGSVDPAKQPGGHLRTNSSVKKPAAFKSVSVTKNFLAKSAVAAPVARPGDKGPSSSSVAASTVQTARPRLVAKSGGSNAPRTLGKLNGAGSGPDASKVWNKNQPIPPAPPKQFTDEELKQQYGIHLATRLQADDGGKEAKWADIDDDEDDWAPETVQWMDGTKSTVAAENQPPPPDDTKSVPKIEASLAIVAPAPAIMPTPTPAPTPSSSTQRSGLTGGTKTILKPGASAQASAAKPKGQLEKPTLVAKPSSAAPVKSPWAQLPPVEKASPIQMNSPAQQPPPRYSRDSYGYDDMTPSHALAKEIAPDDFNRAWRDERGHRELFNSHSGRYEPVGEMRRGSVRDNSYRQQPSVLQRPLQDGPAEPSAAFQTSRTSADGPGWGRRRNSSNVSGGSGRRMSFDRRGPDLPPVPMNLQRRDSQSINGLDAGASGAPQQALPSKTGPTDQPPPIEPANLTQITSPNVAHVQPLSPLESAASHDAGTPGAPSQIQNLVEVQERLLHSNIEAIRSRKQKEKEQEEKEEAERKERLRKRLEALGFTDDAKSKAKEPSPSRAPQKSPQKGKAVPAPVQSPPKPPVPTSEGEVAQYGMMKVHQAQPVRKPVSTEPASKPGAPKSSPSPMKAQTEVQPLPLLAQSISPANEYSRESDSSKPRPDHTQTQAQQVRPAGATDDKVGQPPQGPWSSKLPPQRPVGWGSSGSSVWGPPQARDRALGNGTFGQQVAAPPQSNAATIGLPSLNSIPPQSQAAPVPPFAQQNMYPQAVPALTQGSGVSKPGPIAPPPADKGWGNFQAHIRQDDIDIRAKAERERERVGTDFRPELRETFKDQKGNTETIMHVRVGGIDPKASQPTITPESKHETLLAHEAPISQSASHQPATQGGRSSRFFPKPPPASKQESPPPPETESHPAFSGDISHPVVRMPKPSPRVRLPPTALGPTAHAETPVSMPPRGRLGIGARPLALTQEWQARFNSLLDKTPAAGPGSAPITRPSPSVQAPLNSRPGSLAIAPSSKAPLEVREMSASATVSLPVSTNRRSLIKDGSSDVTTREGAEDLLEDREFGSLPTVKVPKTPHLAANEPPVGFPPSVRQHSKYGGKFYSTSKPTLQEDKPERHDNTIDVNIRMGNVREVVTKSMSIKRKGTRGYSQQKPRRSPANGAGNASSVGQNPRTRKPANYQGQGASSNGPSQSPAGNAWSNNRSSPAHTNPWTTKRQTPSAPVH